MRLVRDRQQLRGNIATLSRHTICRERGLTLVPLTLARLPLFHRRLDADMHMVACRSRAAAGDAGGA